MPLVLTLVLASPTQAGAETRTLARGSLSIGRGAGNDWILPDPQRLLSKTHCAITLQAGPSQAGRCTLTDLSTNGTFVNGAREAVGRDSQLVLTDGDTIRLGSYCVSVTLREGTVATAAELADPFAVEAQGGDDILGADPFGDASVAASSDRGGFAHPLPHAPPSLRHDDPFAEAGGGLDDLFGDAPAGWQGGPQTDKVDAPSVVFTAPRPLAAVDPLDFDALIGELSLGPAPEAPSRPAPRLANPFADETPHATTPPTITASQPLPAGPVGGAAPVEAAPGGLAQVGLAAFLTGAGLPGLVSDSAPEVTLELAGRVFRLMVEGLREVLMSRAAIKSELRVEQTMLRARDNNALKFSVTVEEALAALLLTERPGYKPPEAATAEAFADIRSHEMAVMAGVQTALLGLLRRFDPAELESRLQPGMLDRVLSSQRRARNWEMFCAAYRDIAAEASDDFHSVFGRSFARAYDAQQTQHKSGS